MLLDALCSQQAPSFEAVSFSSSVSTIPSEMLGTVLVTRLQCVGIAMSLAALKENFFLELTYWGTMTAIQSPASIHTVFILLPLLLRPRT